MCKKVTKFHAKNLSTAFTNLSTFSRANWAARCTCFSSSPQADLLPCPRTRLPSKLLISFSFCRCLSHNQTSSDHEADGDRRSWWRALCYRQSSVDSLWIPDPKSTFKSLDIYHLSKFLSNAASIVVALLAI